MFYDPEIRTFEELDAEIAHQHMRLKQSRVSDSEPLQHLFEQRMNLALEQRFMVAHDIAKAAVAVMQREPIVGEHAD